jgi:hypothetical protein
MRHRDLLARIEQVELGDSILVDGNDVRQKPP